MARLVDPGPQRWPVVPGTPFDPLSLERPAVPAGGVELVLGVVSGPDGVYTTGFTS